MDTIYLELVGEGTRVWRPVHAERLSDGHYRIASRNDASEIETWPFQVGDTVECKLRTFSDGSVGLVAVARVGV